MTLVQPVKHLGTSPGFEDNTSPFTVNVLVTDADGSAGTTASRSRSTTTCRSPLTTAILDDAEQVTGQVIGSAETLLLRRQLRGGRAGFACDHDCAGSQGGTVTINAGNLVYTNTTANATPGARLWRRSSTRSGRGRRHGDGVVHGDADRYRRDQRDDDERLLADEDDCDRVIGNRARRRTATMPQIADRDDQLHAWRRRDRLDRAVGWEHGTDQARRRGGDRPVWDSGTNTLTGYGDEPRRTWCSRSCCLRSASTSNGRTRRPTR